MRFGTECPEGFLPVYSVETEEEAKSLIVGACSRGEDGFYYANELAQEQSLGKLSEFSFKLDRVYQHIRKWAQGET